MDNFENKFQAEHDDNKKYIDYQIKILKKAEKELMESTTASIKKIERVMKIKENFNEFCEIIDKCCNGLYDASSEMTLEEQVSKAYPEVAGKVEEMLNL